MACGWSRTSAASTSPAAMRQNEQSGSGNDGQGAGGDAELDPVLLADVVAVDLDRERPDRAIRIVRDRGDGRRGDVVELLDLAVARCAQALAQQAGDQRRGVALCGPL